MLGRAAERFIRTQWKSVQELAEELYATFSPQAPLEASSIVINQLPGQQTAPFVINRAPDTNGGSIQINKDGGSNNFGDVNINGDNFGGLDLNINRGYDDLVQGKTLTIDDSVGQSGIDLSGVAFPGQDPSQKVAAVPIPEFNPFMLYGEVQAVSSGVIYKVKCWARSPFVNASPPIGVLDVRFPMVDPSETIPSGTPVPVLCFPGNDPTNVKTILDAIGFVPTFFG